MDLNDPKLQMLIGMAARLIPRDQYEKLGTGLRELIGLVWTIDARMARIEAGIASMGERVTMLETIVVANVDGAKETYAEAAQWTPDKIAKALAPAVNGALNDDH